MKVVLYMAITVDGFIAKETDETGFTTEIEWDSFRSKAREMGNFIIGRRTYEIMRAGDEFKKLKGVTAVVVTSDKNFSVDQSEVIIATSPEEALRLIEEKDMEKALLAGGGILNKAFAERNLIDELYVDVAPLALGSGIKLFSDAQLDMKLELIGTELLSPNEIQLHYKVLK